MKDDEEIVRHPSFAQISFSRVSGNSNFYGSELQQQHYVSMEIHESSVRRELSKDWYYADKRVLRLRMSAGQFSELITNMNHGMGIPCTLEYADGKLIEQLPQQESRKEFVHRKFNDRMEEFAKTIREKKDQAKEIVKKKTLSKDDIKNLSFYLDYLTQEISGNIPFFAKCFQETVDEVVFEAKLEVENAIQHKISVLGLTELHRQNDLLTEGE
jgi:hypothetical protein